MLKTKMLKCVLPICFSLFLSNQAGAAANNASSSANPPAITTPEATSAVTSPKAVPKDPAAPKAPLLVQPVVVKPEPKPAANYSLPATAPKASIPADAAFSSAPVTYHSKLTAADMILGGIGQDSSLWYVAQVYGQPGKTTSRSDKYGTFTTYNYNEQLIVTEKETAVTGKKFIYEIICREDNLKTNSGLHVGLDYPSVQRTYGVADLSGTNAQGLKYYDYNFSRNTLRMTVGADNKIKELRCMYNA